jgi:hypothetical protein
MITLLVSKDVRNSEDPVKVWERVSGVGKTIDSTRRGTNPGHVAIASEDGGEESSDDDSLIFEPPRLHPKKRVAHWLGRYCRTCPTL